MFISCHQTVSQAKQVIVKNLLLHTHTEFVCIAVIWITTVSDKLYFIQINHKMPMLVHVLRKNTT